MSSVSSQGRIKETLLTAGGSALVCTCIHLAVAPIWRKAVGEQRYLALKRRERLYLAEKTVSSVNGLVSGSLALYVIASGKYRGNVIYPYPKAAHYVLAFFSGYSIYDTTVMALGAHEPLVMWAHHLLGIFGAMGMMYYRQLSFFPVAFAISELTVLPFNLIWYLSKLNVPRTAPIMKFALALRAVAFLTLRAPIGIFTFLYANKQTQGGLRELLRRIFVNKEVPAFLAAGTSLNTLAFSFFNFLWTAQAIKASLKTRNKPE